jgi:hypothetical protein
MKLFGTGVIFAVPLTDALGNAIANPTPSPLGILQNSSLDFEFENKPLYGAAQFPVAVGRGKGKVSGKAQEALINVPMWNNLFFGQPANQVAGLLGVVSDTIGVAIPVTPYQITVVPPSSGTWDTDLGVTDNSNVSYTRVASAPATGQYSVAAGVYTFAAADTTKVVFISYRYSATVTGAKKLTVNNLSMGYAPSIQIDMNVSYNGKNCYVRLPNALPNKFSMPFKNDDWTIPEFNWDCFADGKQQHRLRVDVRVTRARADLTRAIERRWSCGRTEMDQGQGAGRIGCRDHRWCHVRRARRCDGRARGQARAGREVRLQASRHAGARRRGIAMHGRAASHA